MENALKGKVALVTGAGRGLGKEIARTLASDGATVLCIGRELAPIQNTAKEICDAGGVAEAYSLDVSKFADVKACSDEIVKKHGRVDILVNNAGVYSAKIPLVVSESEWRTVMDINITGAFNIVKNFVKGMMLNNWGRIINISSLSGLVGNPGHICYSSSKSAMIGFTKSLSRDLYTSKISVNTIAPGYIDSDIVRDAIPASMVNSILAKIPLERLAKAKEVANACLFLCQDEAEYITGQIIRVDGGMGLQYSKIRGKP